MSGKKRRSGNRVGTLAMHGGVLAWGLCFMVLAEDQRAGTDRSGGTAGKPRDQSPAAHSGQAAKSDEWINRQIKALGDPVYAVRAKATTKLLAAGPRAVAGLTIALNSRDREVARRAEQLLSRLARSEPACFTALEKIACRADHPAAKRVESIIQVELDRRERVLAALALQRQNEAQRLLRAARTALYQRQWTRARRHAKAAQVLDVEYGLFDDRPELVLSAVDFAETNAAPPRTPAVVTNDH